jgi:hypothetical protein
MVFVVSHFSFMNRVKFDFMFFESVAALNVQTLFIGPADTFIRKTLNLH